MAKFRMLKDGVEQWSEEHSDITTVEGFVNSVHGSAPIPEGVVYELVTEGDEHGKEQQPQPVGGGNEPAQKTGDGSHSDGTAGQGEKQEDPADGQQRASGAIDGV